MDISARRFTEKQGRSFRLDYDLYGRILAARAQGQHEHQSLIHKITNQLFNHNARTTGTQEQR